MKIQLQQDEIVTALRNFVSEKLNLNLEHHVGAVYIMDGDGQEVDVEATIELENM